jgi:pyruvate dehydrogenase E2 component (dihydrolipoamide acetyltransferase)
MAYEFRFPDVGEGITEGEIVAWKVSEGESIVEDQTLVEVETDKAVVELPSPKAGKIVRLHAAEGDIVLVGSVLVTIEDSAAQPAGEVPAVTTAVAAPSPSGSAGGQEPEATAEEPYTGSVVGRLEEAPEEEPATAVKAVPSPKPGAETLALPSVRALAKELGVDLATIRGTGTGGRILKQDVEDVAQDAAYGVVAAVPSSPRPTVETRPEVASSEPAGTLAPGVPVEVETPVHGGVIEQDSFGPIERAPFRGVRRTMAKRMAESATKQAQVTTMDEADVTVIRHIREKEREVAAERGVHLTYLAFVIKACAAALQRFPRLNAVLEESGEEYVLKRYYNIGIAVDTKSGLVVPNIKDAGSKSIFTIAAEIIDLVKKADERSLDLAQLHGGTFTITNYGAIGGTFATPIVNYPEVAILGMGRIGEAPVVRDGKVVARLMLPLSLTFDHRLVDGAEAARFLNMVVGYLQDPDLLLLEGA